MERGREQRNRPKESPTAIRIKNWKSDLDYLRSNTILHQGDLRGRSTAGSWKYFLDTSICSSVTGNQDSGILSILEKTLVLF